MPSGWKAAADDPTLTEPVWRAERTATIELTHGTPTDSEKFKSATAWGGVLRFGYADLDYIYRQVQSTPSVPTGGETSETHTPTNWQRSELFLIGRVPRFQVGRTRYYENGSFARASSWGSLTELVSVNAGGTYWATPASGRSYYSASVYATAKGGTLPYAYRWEGKHKDGRSATYLFQAPDIDSKYVTVTDGSGDTATDYATIIVRRQLRIGGASDDFAHDVPLGGTLVFIWGGDGAVTAASEDASVASISVNGAEIVVSGVSAGRTEIAVKPSGGEFRVPVRVGGGG